MPKYEYRNGRYYAEGAPLFFVGVDYQYYRDKRSNWADRLDQIRVGHANVITFYIPWRHHIVHDPQTGAISYDFTGETLDSRDLIRFLDLVAERGLLMVAKPGPFVHSELNIGGLPDVASPTFSPAIEPVRMHDGRPLCWEYDNTQMPSPNDPVFDALAREWLGEVGRQLAPYCGEAGPIIGVQLLDETLYCSSNDPPWTFGYDAADTRLFHALLEEKYGTIARYNAEHATALKSFSMARGPRLRPGEPVVTRREEVAALIDWAEFQWRIRRDFYARYKEYLGLSVPYLSNFAGITPPIQENVPDAAADPAKELPADYVKLYPEWWLAMNRVDADAAVYEYGMISWLGVAAYNIQDASSDPPPIGDNEVFCRYINTAGRRRGINMEENWGFSKLYHPLSKYPLIPFFQTLASVAGGATGYVVFTGVCHAYWLDDLDRTTRKQQRTFPADAPIGENGETGEMYEAMSLINGWFAREGSALLAAEPDVDLAFLIVPEYAAVSSWVPGAAEWGLAEAVPRCGYDVFEPAARIFQARGVRYVPAELAALSDAELAAFPVACLHLAFFLGRAEQAKLVRYAQGGGRLILSGELPAFDERMRPCTVLADFVRTEPAGVLYSTGNVFSDERALLGNLRRAGWTQTVTMSSDLRAFVYHGAEDAFVFFFHFGTETRPGTIAFGDERLDLTLGPKTSGVVRVRGGRIVSYCVKGTNEFEGVRPDIRLALGGQEIRFAGDGSAFDL